MAAGTFDRVVDGVRGDYLATTLWFVIFVYRIIARSTLILHALSNISIEPIKLSDWSKTKHSFER